jgi:hypothetical protein
LPAKIALIGVASEVVGFFLIFVSEVYYNESKFSIGVEFLDYSRHWVLDDLFVGPGLTISYILIATGLWLFGNMVLPSRGKAVLSAALIGGIVGITAPLLLISVILFHNNLEAAFSRGHPKIVDETSWSLLILAGGRMVGGVLGVFLGLFVGVMWWILGRARIHAPGAR